MSIVSCTNCDNIVVDQMKERVLRGVPCEQTLYCRDSAQEHRRLQREENKAYAEKARARKEEKNRRNKANRQARAAYNQAVASGSLLQATRKMGK